jgi:hypothetical protein
MSIEVAICEFRGYRGQGVGCDLGSCAIVGGRIFVRGSKISRGEKTADPGSEPEPAANNERIK